MQKVLNLSRSRPKALLFDVDGVIIKNKQVLTNVSTNIERYFAKKLHLSPKDAVRVNRLIYTEYGHSFYGLKKACGVTSSLDDFNKYVYDEELMSQLSKLKDDFYQSLHSKHLREVAITCKIQKVPIYIFSNAPFEWCHTALEISGLNAFIPNDNIISCDHSILRFFNEDGFKPVGMVYHKLKNYIINTERDDKVLAFVEDSFKNLVPIINDNDWIPIYYNEKSSVHDGLHVVPVSNIHQIKNILCHTSTHH
jgi:hypothetical protein